MGVSKFCIFRKLHSYDTCRAPRPNQQFSPLRGTLSLLTWILHRTALALGQ